MLSYLLAGVASLQLADAVNLWPQPNSMSTGSSTMTVAPNFQFVASSLESDSATLHAAFARYSNLMFPHLASSPDPASCALSSLSVTIADNDESHPQLGTDESYSLNVPLCWSGTQATLSAQTLYGALRGLETFSQLVSFDFDAASYVVSEAPIKVDDAPRFPHRGLMVDTSRHFLTLPALYTIIDSLPYAKLNVLHWHMSDTQSFPLQSPAHPKLWAASFTAGERYLQSDVAAVVEYARQRGVRVMVEFDMPGHAESWCVAYPEVCPSTTCLTPLNVARSSTFDFISALLMEMTGGKTSQPHAPSGLFPENMLHLGGDEVDTSCWGKTPEIASWLVANNMTEDEAYAYFVGKASSIALAQGRRPVQWSEVFDHFKGKLNPATIVHVWKDVTNVTEVVALGYNVLRNVGYDNISWYLDNIDVNWTAVYQNEPCGGVPDSLCPLILGGHGEMWGEHVDISDLEATVWPKLAAIAEKLWSPRSFTTAVGAVDSALPRIERFRCLLNARGIRAAPVNLADARSAPLHPGSCYQ